MFFGIQKPNKEELKELEKIFESTVNSLPIKRDMVKILGTDVWFITQNYSKPETLVQFGDTIKEFNMDFNFVTIASAQPKDVLMEEEYQFTEPVHVFIDYMITRLIQFTLPPMSIKELIWNISRIYTEIFKSFSKEAKVCCQGYEFLYLKKVKIHNDNVVSLSIDQKEDFIGK